MTMMQFLASAVSVLWHIIVFALMAILGATDPALAAAHSYWLLFAFTFAGAGCALLYSVVSMCHSCSNGGEFHDCCTDSDLLDVRLENGRVIVGVSASPAQQQLQPGPQPGRLFTVPLSSTLIADQVVPLTPPSGTPRSA